MSGAARVRRCSSRIDTEGDNQWDVDARGGIRRSRTSTRSAALHDVLRAPRRAADLRHHAIRSRRDRAVRRVLRALLARGDCEIGAHHHAWETPPCAPDDVARHPYALSLPLAQFDAQLASLTDAIADAVGVRPVSYRSGRFGFSAAHVSSLERQGYLVESSVAPLFYEAHKQGPDFVDAPLDAVLPVLRRRDARRARATLLELPISAALNRRVPAVLERWYGRAPWPYTTKRVLRLLARRARPLAAAVVQLGRRHDRARAADSSRRGVPILNLLFHSSEAIVGGSPYNRTDAELDAFFDRLGRC